MKNKGRKRRKKHRLQPRFFIIIFVGLIIGGIAYQVNLRNQPGTMPNFHGWLVQDVEAYVDNRPNMSVIVQWEHSDSVEPTRIVSQSLQPGRVIGDEAVVVSVTASLGKEVGQ